MVTCIYSYLSSREEKRREENKRKVTELTQHIVGPASCRRLAAEKQSMTDPDMIIANALPGLNFNAGESFSLSRQEIVELYINAGNNSIYQSTIECKWTPSLFTRIACVEGNEDLKDSSSTDLK